MRLRVAGRLAVVPQQPDCAAGLAGPERPVAQLGQSRNSEPQVRLVGQAMEQGPLLRAGPRSSWRYLGYRFGRANG